MTPSQVLNYYNSQTAAAAAAGVKQPAVSAWVKRGSVPSLAQLRLEAHSGGALKADRKILLVHHSGKKIT